MSDPTTSSPGASDREVLLRAVADAVGAVPGVVRLEPTLSTSGPGLLLRRNRYDGIRLLVRAGAVQVDVNVATHAACPARAVAHEIRARVAGVLSAHGLPNSSTTVTVLSIESQVPAEERFGL